MDTSKVCPKCQQSKTIEQFTFPKRKVPVGRICIDCQTQKGKEEYQVRREAHLAYRKKYYAENKESILANTKTEAYKNDRNAKKKIRRKNDIQFRITESLKVRIHEVLKEYKDTSSNYLLGCTKGHIVSWLTYQQEDGIDWDNYASHWHIDHVIPLAFFDITIKAEQLMCFNWMNLRPLEKGLNMIKSANIIQNDILAHIEILEKFITENIEYQECYNNSIWPRIKLGYGKNLTDTNVDMIDVLKSVIRNQNSN
jgi:hypothetical protein